MTVYTIERYGRSWAIMQGLKVVSLCLTLDQAHKRLKELSLSKRNTIMKQSVSFNTFVDAFKAYNRYDGYGYEALRVIFDYLEQYEEETGEEIELDVVAICCDYNAEQYTDIAKTYSIDLEDLDEDEAKQAVIDYIQDNSAYLGEATDGELVYQVF